MKYTVGQFNVKSKDLAYNYNKIEGLVKAAKKDGYGLIVFSDYALTGYGCLDLFLDEGFLNDVEYYNQKVIALADQITIIFGSVINKPDGLYSGAIIANNETINYSFKETLSKEEFDESRYFKSGKNRSVSIDGQLFKVTFSHDIKMQSSNLIILDSARYPKYLTADNFSNTIYANSTGITSLSKHVFINGGHSFIKMYETLRVYKKPLCEGLLVDNETSDGVSLLELLSNTIRIWDFENFNGNVKWIVGNSGGIDSALTLALLKTALGEERIVAYNLATKYNSAKTIANAQHLGDKLGIKHIESNIQELTDNTLSLTRDAGYQQEYSSLVAENIQARLRGHVLSTFSAIEGGVVCNNGNKVELALGYCTLYGDTIGALSPIGDLLKIELFDLAHQINDYYQDEIIPNNLIPVVTDYSLEWDLPPTAELKDDQIDPMKWYYHDHLLELLLEYGEDYVIQAYAKNKLADHEAGKWLSYYHLDDPKAFVDDLEWFMRTMQINQFKRVQTPPFIVLSDHVIGVDYLETSLLKPKSQDYIKTKNELLK